MSKMTGDRAQTNIHIPPQNSQIREKIMTIPANQNPLFTVFDNQLIVSCYDEPDRSAFAIGQIYWQEYLANRNISLKTPDGFQIYEKVFILTLDERGDADIYAKSSDASFNSSKRFRRDS